MDAQLALQIALTSVPVGVFGLLLAFVLTRSQARPVRGDAQALSPRPMPWWTGVVLAAIAIGLSRPILGAWPSWPPARGDAWVPWITLLAGVAAAVVALCRRVDGSPRWAVIWPILVQSVALGAYLPLRRTLESGGVQAWVSVFLLAFVVGSAFVLGMARLSMRRGAGPVGAIAAIVSASAVLLVAGFASLTQGRMVGVHAAFLTGVALVLCLRAWRGRGGEQAGQMLGLSLTIVASLSMACSATQAWAFGTSPAPWVMAFLALAPWTVLAIASRTTPLATAGSFWKLAIAHWVGGVLWIVAATGLCVVVDAQRSRFAPDGPAISDYE